jgi:hypothetical protein
MKLLVVSILFLLAQSTTSYPSKADHAQPFWYSQENSETVYICDSKNATKYHSKENCGGLQNCKAEIKEIKKSEAIRLDRTECLKCW